MILKSEFFSKKLAPASTWIHKKIFDDICNTCLRNNFFPRLTILTRIVASKKAQMVKVFYKVGINPNLSSG
jgi:hypothetical protein